jgi:dipeptide transport system ATP-binding protein
VLNLSDRARRKIIGGDVAMIFQEPTTSLNPCFTIGFQLAETLRLHSTWIGRPRASDRSSSWSSSAFPPPKVASGDFPHQMSGGMNQRVMIAMAIAAIRAS